jgi:hypothetical protein
LEEYDELPEPEGQAEDDSGDGSILDKMLAETLWTWTAHPLHILCMISECEEEQVAVDMHMDGAGSGSGAGERGNSPESTHAADEQTGSSAMDVSGRERAPISCEVKSTHNASGAIFSTTSSTA